jgi:hypothetical protein
MKFNLKLKDNTIALIGALIVVLGLIYLVNLGMGMATSEGFVDGNGHMGLKVSWKSKPYPGGQHGDASPAKIIGQVVKEFGLPDMIDVNPGGMAVWKKETLKGRGFCWDRIEIHDEQIPHLKPKPHVDFLYTWYYLPVKSLVGDKPEEYKRLVNDINNLSESVVFDEGKQLVRVRCNFHGANVANLVLAKRIATREITLQQALNLYEPTIMSTISGSTNYDPDAYNKYVVELCNLHTREFGSDH